MNYLTVKDLKEILNNYEENLYAIVTRDGNGHSFPIKESDIQITTAYFPNQEDYDAIGGGDEDERKKYLNIGSF